MTALLQFFHASQSLPHPGLFWLGVALAFVPFLWVVVTLSSVFSTGRVRKVILSTTL